MVSKVSQSTSPLKLGALLAGAAVLGTPLAVRAGGFSLLEQTGSGIGYAYAGSGASADDASAMFFNPAALTMIDATQVALAVHGIDLKAKFNDAGSTLPAAGLGLFPTGATQSDAGRLIALPNAYLAVPFSERVVFGFAVNSPFGLITEYDDPWIGRFQGIRSKLTTVNANPALAYQYADNASVGIGVNYQYAKAELSNAVVLGLATEGRANVDVNDSAIGWNIGWFYRLATRTRIGLSYRSRLQYTLDGDTTVTTLAGQTVSTTPTNIDITFPDSAQISIAQPIGHSFELRGDVMWMNWSQIGTINAVNSTSGAILDVLNFGFKDTVRAAIGVDYKLSQYFSFRAGTAFDQSPVSDSMRTVRLPDNDRIWATVGARARVFDKFLFDVGYARLFVPGDTTINLTRTQTGAAPAALFTSLVTGSYDSSVSIYSLQMTYSFR